VKWEDMNAGLKAPVGTGTRPPEADGTFVKICYYEPVLRRMHDYTHQFNIRNGRKINLEAEKWYGKQQCLPIGHKKWAGDCPVQ